MRPADDIKKMIQDWNDTTSAQMDERVLADVGRALEQSQTQAAPAEPSLRRIIMKSPMTKLAAAAAIIIAVIFSLFLIDLNVAPDSFEVEQFSVNKRVEHVTAELSSCCSTGCRGKRVVF